MHRETIYLGGVGTVSFLSLKDTTLSVPAPEQFSVASHSCLPSVNDEMTGTVCTVKNVLK